MIFSKIGVFYMENLNSFVTIQKFNEKGYINLNYVFSDLFNGEYPMLHPINSSNIKYFPQIEYFVPKKLKEDFDGDLEENLKYLTYDTNKNYRLGNKIVKNMSKQMVLDFAEQLSISLDNKEIEILDDKQLINFFKIISDKIVPKEILSWGNDIYNIYLSQNDYKQLLSRLVLSLLSLQQPSYAQTERKYLKAVNEEDNYTILSTIWGTFSDSNYKMFKKTVIAFNERKDYDAVKNICELNREFLEEEHEINYLYAAALANCGDITNAEDILNKEQFNDYPNAQYVLYKIYNGAFGSFDTEDLNEKCKKALSKASNLGQPNAALIFIRELFDDNFNVNYNTIKSLLTKMKNNIIELNDTQKGWYYYYSGCCKEKDNLLEEANMYFDKALECGIEFARTKSSRVPRRTVDFSKNFDSETHKNICIINSNNDDTKTLLRTLPDDYTVYSINTDFADTEIHNIISFSSIKTCIDTLVLKADNCEKAVVAFLSDNEQENLNYGLETLDRLYNEALNKENSDKLDFINIFDVFIKSNYDFASVFIDASISDMGDSIYFRTHIIDPYRNSIQKLLYEKPLFLPILSSNETDNNTVLFSNNVSFSYSLLKELIAVGYMGEGHKTNATVICNKNIENELNNKLCKEMPGIYKNDFSLILKEVLDLDKNKTNKQFGEFPIIEPNIKGLDETIVPISSLLCTSAYGISNDKIKNIKNNENLTNEEKGLISKLNIKEHSLFKEYLEYYEKINLANYFIVDVGSDEENIDFAINLRRQLIANSEGMIKKPFIAVYCRDSKTAYLANRMTLSNKNQGEHWHNRYDLYFFGMSDTLYSYEAMINNDLETQALEIHKSYCKLESNDTYSKEYFDALNSFYSYQYNIDSSLATAIGLRYRLFIAQLYKDKEISSEFSLEDDCDKSPLFENYLNDEFESYNDDAFAKIEQYRWNNFMLSRGWQAPTWEQLCTYLKDETITNHKHMLLKLHPYIAKWDDLDDDGDICKEIKKYKKLFDLPKSITQDSINKTTHWLSLFKDREHENKLNTER